MNNQEYNKWVDYIYTNGKCPNRKLIENYSDWKHKKDTAHFLILLNEFKPAIEILKTIVDVQPEEEGDIEKKAWALKLLAHSILSNNNNAEEAMNYVDMALEIAEGTGEEFNFITRGELFRDRLELLVKLRKEEEALSEAAMKIAFYENKENTSSHKNINSNSYLFYSLGFKAYRKYFNGDMEQACYLLKEALKYFPDEYEDMNNLEEIWDNREENYENAYNKMLELTHHRVTWDI